MGIEKMRAKERGRGREGGVKRITKRLGHCLANDMDICSICRVKGKVFLGGIIVSSVSEDGTSIETSGSKKEPETTY